MIVEWLGQEDVVVTTTVPTNALNPQLRPVLVPVMTTQVPEEKKSSATPWIVGGLVLVGGVLLWRWLS